MDFCPFPSGYKYDICFNNIQSKLASSHSYCRIQLIQTIYLPLPPQQIQSVSLNYNVLVKYQLLVLIVGLIQGATMVYTLVTAVKAGNLTKKAED